VNLQIFVITLGLVLLAIVIEVVRRRRLSEGYALLWIAVGVGGVLLGVARPLIDRFSDSLGVSYGANLVFAFVFVFLIVVCINLSMHVSKLEDQVTSLAEELALVRGPQAGDPQAASPPPRPAVPPSPSAASEAGSPTVADPP
jgi:hypothetical protein